MTTPTGNIAAPNILIIEDDIQLADIFEKALQKEGFRTKVVNNGNDAFPAAQADQYDLVLLDIKLPGKDGFQVLKQLKEDSQVKHVRVLMLTNLGDTELINRALKLGAADYIIKESIDFPSIQKMMNKHLVTFNARVNLNKE